jgi:hypothetical protein
MRITLSYFGEVSEDGQISLPKRMRTEMAKAFKGKRIEVSIKQRYKQRSSPQLRYYFGVIVRSILLAFIELGHDLQVDNPEHIQMVHEFLKHKFLHNGITIVNIHGEVEQLAPSTTRLTTVEEEDYHEDIRRWAAEFLNVVIALPNEQLEIFKP